MGKRAELIERLHNHGVEGWADTAKAGTPKFKWIPLAKMETSHMGCMVQRLNDPRTNKQLVEDGVWSGTDLLPPRTRAEFDAIKGAGHLAPVAAELLRRMRENH